PIQLKSLAAARQGRIIQIIEFESYPAVAITAREGRQVGISRLPCVILPSTFVPDAKLGSASKRAAEINPATYRIDAVSCNFLSVFEDIERNALGHCPWSDEPVALRSERMVILRAQSILRKQNDVSAPFGSETSDIEPGNAGANIEEHIFVVRTVN